MMKKSFVFFIESNLAAYNYTNMDIFLFLNKIIIESLFRLHFVCNSSVRPERRYRATDNKRVVNASRHVRNGANK